MNTICITAKCSDMFSAVMRKDGKAVGRYNGYVPPWFPTSASQNDGDYVVLEIDITTGRIVNWRKPTAAQLKSTFTTV